MFRAQSQRGNLRPSRAVGYKRKPRLLAMKFFPAELLKPSKSVSCAGKLLGLGARVGFSFVVFYSPLPSHQIQNAAARFAGRSASFPFVFLPLWIPNTQYSGALRVPECFISFCCRCIWAPNTKIFQRASRTGRLAMGPAGLSRAGLGWARSFL